MRGRNVLLQDEAYQFLKKKIIEGDFEKDRIYSLNVITASLDMSKTPVRDALMNLDKEGLIDILPSRGFCLHQITRKEVIELFQFRCAIEGYCAFRLTMDYIQTGICPEMEEMAENLEEQKKVIQDGGCLKEFLQVDREFHNVIINSSGNGEFQTIMRREEYKNNDFTLNSLSQHGRLEKTVEEHEEIMKWIGEKDPVKAQSAMLAHLGTPLETALETMNTV